MLPPYNVSMRLNGDDGSSRSGRRGRRGAVKKRIDRSQNRDGEAHATIPLAVAAKMQARMGQRCEDGGGAQGQGVAAGAQHEVKMKGRLDANQNSHNRINLLLLLRKDELIYPSESIASTGRIVIVPLNIKYSVIYNIYDI